MATDDILPIFSIKNTKLQNYYVRQFKCDRRLINYVVKQLARIFIQSLCEDDHFVKIFSWLQGHFSQCGKNTIETMNVIVQFILGQQRVNRISNS